jgi:hypothetical protein
MRLLVETTPQMLDERRIQLDQVKPIALAQSGGNVPRHGAGAGANLKDSPVWFAVGDMPGQRGA